MKTAWISEALQTSFGPVWVAVSKAGLVGVEFSNNLSDLKTRLQRQGFTSLLVDKARTGEILEQIKAYLDGERQNFELVIDWSVLSPFQKRSLKATLAIPYGKTKTYGEIAAQIGSPAAARAVGRAEATNPMPLVIPCHRVVGSDGKLHGYGGSGGLATKAWLIDMERMNAAHSGKLIK